MVLYTENHNDTIRKSLELINEYNKVSGYKINTQISLAFPYPKNEKQKENLGNNPIKHCQKKKKKGIHINKFT